MKNKIKKLHHKKNFISIALTLVVFLFNTLLFAQNNSQKFLKYTSGIRSILEDSKDNIWFEGANGISSFDGKILKTHTEIDFSLTNDWQSGEENYYSVTTPFLKAKNGTLWFGTYGALIGFNGTGFTIINNESLGLSKKTGFLHIRSIFEDSKGNIWIGNNSIGVLKYDGKSAVNITNKFKPKIQSNSLKKVFAVGEDSSENMWFGTYGSGVWRFDDNLLTNFTKENGLQSKHIWRIYKNKSGELWFAGAEPSGVYVFNGSSFERKF